MEKSQFVGKKQVLCSQSHAISEIENYEAIYSNDLTKIEDEKFGNESFTMKSNSLLFLILRYSTINAIASHGFCRMLLRQTRSIKE
jgi:hypothetical protein